MALTYLNSVMIELPASIATLSTEKLNAENFTGATVNANAINTTDLTVRDINMVGDGGNILNNVQLFGNLTVVGNITATNENTLVFTNTTTTTALSVENIGLGSALYVNQGPSVEPVAVIKGNNIEILRVNNVVPDSGQTGVVINYNGSGNTFAAGPSSLPDAFIIDSIGNTTLKGILSAKDITGDVITGIGGNSNLWNKGYEVSTVFSANSARYESVYNNVKTLSTSWEETDDIIPTTVDYLLTNEVVLCSVKVNNTIEATTLTANNIITNEFTILSTTPIQFSNDVGTAGAFKWDSDYLYICVSTNDWKRVALSAW